MDYDHLAEAYARHRGIHPGVLHQLIERGDVTAQTRVLEVGCGTGNYLIAIQQQTGCAAIGVDPSSAMLATAASRAPSISWLHGRAEALPVDGDSVDHLFSVDVIHHVGGRSAFFDEASRVLAPGGTICIVTDSEDDIRRRRPLSSHFPETVAFELNRYPAIGTLEQELWQAGFTRIDAERVELEYELSDIRPYRDRAFSSLHLVPNDAVERGVALLESGLANGPVMALSLYTLVWGRR